MNSVPFEVQGSAEGAVLVSRSTRWTLQHSSSPDTQCGDRLFEQQTLLRDTRVQTESGGRRAPKTVSNDGTNRHLPQGCTKEQCLIKATYNRFSISHRIPSRDGQSLYPQSFRPMRAARERLTAAAELRRKGYTLLDNGTLRTQLHRCFLSCTRFTPATSDGGSFRQLQPLVRRRPIIGKLD